MVGSVAQSALALAAGQPDRRKLDAAIRAGNTVALLGDSITAQNDTYNSGTTYGKLDKGYWHLTNVLLGQRCQLVASSGHGGFRADQLLTYVASDIAPVQPAFCVEESGLNDVGAGASATTVVTRKVALYDAMLAYGMRPVATTITPDENFTVANGQAAVWAETNRRIREYCRSHPAVLLCDWAGAYLNWDGTAAAGRITPSTTIVGLADATFDNIVHPSAYGSALLAGVLADTLRQVIPESPVLPAWNYDPGNLLTNGLQSGTAGTHSFGTSTGSLATGWNLSVQGGTSPAASAVASKVARSDGQPGVWQQIVYSGGDTPTSSSWQYFRSDVNTGFTAGTDSVFARVEFEQDADNSAQVSFEAWLLCRDGGGTVYRTQYLLLHDTAQKLAIFLPSGVMECDSFLIPAGTTQLRLFIKGVTPAGTVRIGRCEIRKVLT